MSKQLHTDWFTEGWIDFEYKKYVLLAYLQHVSSNFNEAKLYPPLGELIHHFRNLNDFRSNRDLVIKNLPKDLKGLDMRHYKLLYEQIGSEDQTLAVVNEIVDFAIPLIQRAITEGKDLYDLIEDQMAIESIGLLPIYKDEGYMMLMGDGNRDVMVYRYRMSRIISDKEDLRSLQTEYLDVQTRTISNSLEHIKAMLIKRFTELPNPAAFAVRSRLKVPLSETFLPVARRLLMKELVHAA